MASQTGSNEEYHFIKGRDSPLHPLHKADFKVDGITYKCIDQYVLCKKIEMADARKHLNEVMKISDPSRLKSFEEKLSLIVDVNAWKEEQKKVTKRAYHEKSFYCKLLHNLLLDTRGKVLVYASRRDVTLGIGLDWDDPLSRRQMNWKGMNLLGKWLKEVQEEILEEQSTVSNNSRMNQKEESNVIESSKETKELSRDGVQEKFTFFWSGSPFSQWHHCSFVVDDVHYNCAEQYMMHQKAVIFLDKESACKIMETKSPKEQKSLGRNVSGFDEKIWEKISRDVVKKGNLAKFSQNEDLKKILFETAGTTLVEASPYDSIWGIGLVEDDPRAMDPGQWKGENRLGKVLTEVREELMNGKVNSTILNRTIHTTDKEHKSKDAMSSKHHGNKEDCGPPKHRPKSGMNWKQVDNKASISIPVSSENSEYVDTKEDWWNGGREVEKRQSRWSDAESGVQKRNDEPEQSNINEDKQGRRISFDTGTAADHSGGEKFTFFWRADSPFSQHHPANFYLDGVNYNCAEQYMMNQKAVVFKDTAISKEILSTNNPARQKSLAKQVKGFDDEHWKTIREKVVKQANIAKFGQNPRLRRMLFATAGTTLVEASPMDQTWGIGLNADDTNAWKRNTWKGTNLLGKILTEVREELMSEGNKNSMDCGNEDVGERAFQRKQSGECAEQYTVFWRPVSPFHLRYPVAFTVDNVNYWTLLQYLVHQKALFFKDTRTEKEAMSTSRLNKLEELGRKVRNYDCREWSKYCRSYLIRGNFAKFSQNPNIGQQLIDNVINGDLAYAVEEDRLLGIGLREEDGRVRRKKSWKGKNLLGESLMEVREMLLNKSRRNELPAIRKNDADEADIEETQENIFFFHYMSPLNHWKLCRFHVDDTQYNSVEQYVYHQSALYFKDFGAATAILKCHHPRGLQEIYVIGYDRVKWATVARDYYKKGNYAKFSQNYKLLNELLDTEDSILAYSDDHDLDLGIGLRDKDPQAWDKRNWPGRNILGQVLMEVREELKKEDKRYANRNSPSRESLASSRGEKFTFFWQRSPFSQWFMCDIYIDKIHYNCTEQYMMYQKAVHFNDEQMATEIMNTAKPFDQWKLGRKVRNYSRDSWNAVCEKVVKRGNLEKFRQHNSLKQKLFATAGTTLAEASNKDLKWGIGLRENDPSSKNRERWPGRNLLGQILMEVREELMKEEQSKSGSNREDLNLVSGSDSNWRRLDDFEGDRKFGSNLQSGESNLSSSSQRREKSSSGNSAHGQKLQKPEFSNLDSNNDCNLVKAECEPIAIREHQQVNEQSHSATKGKHALPENHKMGQVQDFIGSRRDGHQNQKASTQEKVTIGNDNATGVTEGSKKPMEILFIHGKLPLDLWFKCCFVANEVTYNSVGQYMAHQKALMFGDDKSAKDILESVAPLRIMKFMKHIEGSQPEKWNVCCKDVLIDGNYFKFSQNEDLRKDLLASTDKLLVYVDDDKQLGIGLKPKHTDVNDQSKWTGENLLGYTLMDLRKHLIEGTDPRSRKQERTLSNAEPCLTGDLPEQHESYQTSEVGKNAESNQEQQKDLSPEQTQEEAEQSHSASINDEDAVKLEGSGKHVDCLNLEPEKVQEVNREAKQDFEQSTKKVFQPTESTGKKELTGTESCDVKGEHVAAENTKKEEHIMTDSTASKKEQTTSKSAGGNEEHIAAETDERKKDSTVTESISNKHDRAATESAKVNTQHTATDCTEGKKKHTVTDSTEGKKKHTVTDSTESKKKHTVADSTESKKKHTVTDSTEGKKKHTVTDSIEVIVEPAVAESADVNEQLTADKRTVGKDQKAEMESSKGADESATDENRKLKEKIGVVESTEEKKGNAAETEQATATEDGTSEQTNTLSFESVTDVTTDTEISSTNSSVPEQTGNSGRHEEEETADNSKTELVTPQDSETGQEVASSADKEHCYIVSKGEDPSISSDTDKDLVADAKSDQAVRKSTDVKQSTTLINAKEFTPENEELLEVMSSEIQQRSKTSCIVQSTLENFGMQQSKDLDTEVEGISDLHGVQAELQIPKSYTHELENETENSGSKPHDENVLGSHENSGFDQGDNGTCMVSADCEKLEDLCPAQNKCELSTPTTHASSGEMTDVKCSER